MKTRALQNPLAQEGLMQSPVPPDSLENLSSPHRIADPKLPTSVLALQGKLMPDNAPNGLKTWQVTRRNLLRLTYYDGTARNFRE